MFFLFNNENLCSTLLLWMVDKDCDPKCAADFCVDACILYFSSSSLMEINCSKLKYDHDTMDKLMKMPVWPCSLHYEKSLKKKSNAFIWVLICASAKAVCMWLFNIWLHILMNIFALKWNSVLFNTTYKIYLSLVESEFYKASEEGFLYFQKDIRLYRHLLWARE